jgi:hypothetical protein
VPAPIGLMFLIRHQSWGNSGGVGASCPRHREVEAPQQIRRLDERSAKGLRFSVAVSITASNDRVFVYVTLETGWTTSRIMPASVDARYNPKRLHGVSVFTEEPRSFAVGERVRFTQPFSDKRIANGEKGTVAAITCGTIRVRLDSEKQGEGKGRSVRFALKDYAHLDYAYAHAQTSSSTQSQTSIRMLFVVDPDRGGASQNTRTAYVGPTRGREDIRVYCDEKERIVRDLSRDVSHRSAVA